MKLKFRINKELDIQTANNFYGYKCAGIDFGESIIHTFPKLENKTDISKEVNLFYKKHSNKLKTKIKTWQRKWSKIEKRYFKLVEELFNKKWPKGKYICYVSAFNCNPRFLTEKTFQIYYKKDKELVAIAHELLHFMFYDYFSKKFKGKLNKEKLWRLSEVFNVIVLNTKEFQSLIKYRETPYPEHKNLYQKLNKIYNKHNNIKDFIKEAIKC